MIQLETGVRLEYYESGARGFYRITGAPEVEDYLGAGEADEIVENPDNPLVDFTVSSISPRNKVTLDADLCIVTLNIGQNEDGLMLSLLAHLTPGAFHKSSGFEELYCALLSDFAAQTTKRTRMSIIFGGVEPTPQLDEFLGVGKYNNAINILTGLHERSLQVHTLALPPKKHLGTTNVVSLTQERLARVIETGIPARSQGLHVAMPHLRRMSTPVEV